MTRAPNPGDPLTVLAPGRDSSPDVNNKEHRIMSKLHISATVEVPDGAREQARIMAALDPAAKALEAAIKEASGHHAAVEMRVVKHKEKATPAATPASIPSLARVPAGE